MGKRDFAIQSKVYYYMEITNIICIALRGMCLGLIFLLIILVFEVCFSIYCIRLKSYEDKKRSIIRIIALLAFIFIILISDIEWSFRWYAFFIWLLILAILGTVSLVHEKKENNKVFKRSKVIKRSIAIFGGFFLALTPVLIFPQYKHLPVTGTYSVATTVYTYTDDNRIEIYSDSEEHRKVTVQYWYPENTDSTFPLVVFSHGAFGIRTSNLSLYRELASNGYIVCSIDHTYHCFFTKDDIGKTTLINRNYMKEVLSEDAHTNKKQSYEYYQKWMDIRKSDINFVINYILEETDKDDSDKVYKLVNIEKLGVMGHSLGGSAALGIGRSRNDVSAVIALESPYLCDIIGAENEQFLWNEEKYPIPVLNIYSDSSWSHLLEWTQYKKNADMLVDSDADVYNVYLQGAGHLTLTDLALTSPALTRILNGQSTTIDTEYCLKTINQIALEFFNYYLKGHDTLNLPITPLGSEF